MKILLREFLGQLKMKNVVDLWDDDVPNWAMAAKGIVDLEKVSDPMEYRKGLSNRKGPAIFGFSRASSIEKDQLESVEALTMTYSATMLGRSVARLYLSPLSGRALYDGLIRASQILNGIDCCWPDISIFPSSPCDLNSRLSEILGQG